MIDNLTGDAGGSTTGYLELVKTLMESQGGILTGLIAVVVAFIAWRQYMIEKEKLKLALYEKRFSVFRGAMELIESATTDGKLEMQELNKFYASTAQGVFLFEGDVNSFLSELRKNSIEFRALGRWLGTEKFKTDEERAGMVARESELLSWFNSQLAVAVETFKPYLRIPAGR